MSKINSTASGMRWWGLALAALAAWQTISTPSYANRPNIVLIFADDQGWKDVGYQSDGEFLTPNMDQLATEGMIFTDAYAAAGNCAPSRACLLSGNYTPRHHVYAVNSTARGPENLRRLIPIPNRSGLSPSVVTIAEALKEAGYATGHFGKWHLADDVGERHNIASKQIAKRDELLDDLLAWFEATDALLAHQPNPKYSAAAADKPNVLFIAVDDLRPELGCYGEDKIHSPNIATAQPSRNQQSPRPNIVFCMADDWSWPHAGILGDPVVKTPHFDQIAREGVLFENAFVSTPSCTPSRLSILTGQHHWRLKEGDSLGGSLREEFDVYTEILQKSGYRIGRFGKGVWPSKHTFRKRDSFGERFRSFDEFLKDRKPGEPFCYWHGGQDPHRPYELGIGVKSGIKLSDVKVPACLPDNETVRSDVADYLWEVQRFDREVGEIVARLKAMGELENTIIVVSGDNGLPFPRCKATLYDQGTRVPLAIRWGSKVKGNRRISDFVNLCDLAPTFLEAAGVKPPELTGNLISHYQS